MICLPGLVISTPRLLTNLESTIAASLPPEETLPPRALLVGVGILQNVLIVALAAGLGLAVAPVTGLDAPIFEALLVGERPWELVQDALLAVLLWVPLSAVPFLAVYYGFLRSRLDPQTVVVMESLRRNLGVAGRLLYGGIVEEVMVRWGLMGVLAWLGTVVVGATTAAVVWVAIVVSGVLFGLGHLPSHFAAGCKKSPLFISAAIVLNLWLSLVFGWLFWQYGLLAAMLGHMLFHLIWLPFEHYFYRIP